LHSSKSQTKPGESYGFKKGPEKYFGDIKGLFLKLDPNFYKCFPLLCRA